ncbi:MAG: glycosyltransferase family 39 protein, partial [Anaerolineae bacterium]|nr:glycosyltransferase family 39 protein [Anaerolineae bacterium]
MNELPTSADVETEIETPAPRRPGDFWFAYVVFIGFCIAALLVLPAQASSLLLVAAIFLSIVFIARDAEVSFRQFISLPVQVVRAVRSPDIATLNQKELRTQAGAVAAIVSTIFMFWAAHLMRPNEKDELVNQGVVVLLIGGALLGITLWLYRYDQPGVTISDQPLTPARSRPGITLFGLLMLLLLAEISGNLLGLKLATLIPHRIEFLLMIVGCGCIVWGLSGTTTLPKRFDLTIWRYLRHETVLSLLLIFVLALFLRTVNLNNTIRSSVDEVLVINSFNQAFTIKDAGLATQVSHFHTTTQLYPFLQTELVNLTGRTLGGFRLINALIGSLTVFAVYLLTEALFDRKTALIAAFMLAVFPPHIHFSRIAMAHIADPIMGTLTFAFIARGLSDNRRLDWVLAGMALGFTQYFFEGGRLLFPILTIGWIGLLLLIQRRQVLFLARGLMIMLIVAFIVMMPVYYSILARNDTRTARLDASGVGTNFWSELAGNGISFEDLRVVGQRFLSPLLIYIHQLEIQYYYAGPTAIFLEAVAPLFFLTMFYLLWRWRRPEAFLAVWVILAAVANGVV